MEMDPDYEDSDEAFDIESEFHSKTAFNHMSNVCKVFPACTPLSAPELRDGIQPTSLDWHPSGMVAYASSTAIRIVSNRDPKLYAVINDHKDRISIVRFAPIFWNKSHASTILSVDQAGLILLHELETCSIVAKNVELFNSAHKVQDVRFLTGLKSDSLLLVLTNSNLVRMLRCVENGVLESFWSLSLSAPAVHTSISSLKPNEIAVYLKNGRIACYSDIRVARTPELENSESDVRTLVVVHGILPPTRTSSAVQVRQILHHPVLINALFVVTSNHLLLVDTKANYLITHIRNPLPQKPFQWMICSPITHRITVVHENLSVSTCVDPSMISQNSQANVESSQVAMESMDFCRHLPDSDDIKLISANPFDLSKHETTLAVLYGDSTLVYFRWRIVSKTLTAVSKVHTVSSDFHSTSSCPSMPLVATGTKRGLVEITNYKYGKVEFRFQVDSRPIRGTRWMATSSQEEHRHLLVISQPSTGDESWYDQIQVLSVLDGSTHKFSLKSMQKHTNYAHLSPFQKLSSIRYAKSIEEMMSEVCLAVDKSRFGTLFSGTVKGIGCANRQGKFCVSLEQIFLIVYLSEDLREVENVYHLPRVSVFSWSMGGPSLEETEDLVFKLKGGPDCLLRWLRKDDRIVMQPLQLPAELLYESLSHIRYTGNMFVAANAENGVVVSCMCDWDSSIARVTAELRPEISISQPRVQQLQLSPSHSHASVLYQDGTCIIWDPQNGTVVSHMASSSAGTTNGEILDLQWINHDQLVIVHSLQGLITTGLSLSFHRNSDCSSIESRYSYLNLKNARKEVSTYVHSLDKQIVSRGAFYRTEMGLENGSNAINLYINAALVYGDFEMVLFWKSIKKCMTERKAGSIPCTLLPINQRLKLYADIERLLVEGSTIEEDGARVNAENECLITDNIGQDLKNGAEYAQRDRQRILTHVSSQYLLLNAMERAKMGLMEIIKRIDSTEKGSAKALSILRTIIVSSIEKESDHHLLTIVAALELAKIGHALDGMVILISKGLFNEACSYLQEHGYWEESIVLAISYEVSHESLLNLYEEWIEHCISNGQEFQALMIATASKAYPKVLKILHQMDSHRWYPVAQFFADICIERAWLVPEGDEDQEVENLLRNVYSDYVSFLAEVGEQETAEEYSWKSEHYPEGLSN